MLGKLISPIAKLLGKVIVDKDQRNALAHEIATMAERHAQELAKGQLEVNKAEAESGSLFIGGWRPACGWVCVLGLSYNVLISQVLAIWFVVPEVDTSLLTPILLGMLGLGGLRSYEKKTGVAKK